MPKYDDIKKSVKGAAKDIKNFGRKLVDKVERGIDKTKDSIRREYLEYQLKNDYDKLSAMQIIITHLEIAYLDIKNGSPSISELPEKVMKLAKEGVKLSGEWLEDLHDNVKRPYDELSPPVQVAKAVYDCCSTIYKAGGVISAAIGEGFAKLKEALSSVLESIKIKLDSASDKFKFGSPE